MQREIEKGPAPKRILKSNYEESSVNAWEGSKRKVTNEWVTLVGGDDWGSGDGGGGTWGRGDCRRRRQWSMEVRSVGSGVWTNRFNFSGSTSNKAHRLSHWATKTVGHLTRDIRAPHVSFDGDDEKTRTGLLRQPSSKAQHQNIHFQLPCYV